MPRRIAAAIFFLLLSPPLHANDSTAELAAGGLVLTKNADIEMRAEDLFISARAVRVRYKFFNRADRDVTVRVAFPVPDISMDEPDANIAVPTDDPVNILGFRTFVNGKPVRMKVEQRVFAGKKEYSGLLQQLGIPLAPHLSATNRALDNLPPERQADLVQKNLAEAVEYDIGKGMEKHLSPRWTLRTNYHWEQIFPAHAVTEIEHSYKPSVGQTAGTSVGGDFQSEQVDIYRKKYCLDRDFIESAARIRKAAKADYPPFTEERIEYILSTGANWSGPIRDFRLVVDKGAKDNLVSFCGDGVRKIAPAQFEMKKTNFTPKGNFAVLILKRIRGN